MNIFFISFIITLIAGLSTLIGGFIPFINISSKEKIIAGSLAFSAGIMVCISFLDLLPNGFLYLYGKYKIFSIFYIFIFILIGLIIFFILEKVLTKKIDNLFRVGIFSLVGIILHNIPEGIITFLLTSKDVKLGLFMGLSIALHNIPEGISIMVPIYYGSNSFKKAFFYTFLAGISEVIGGVVFYIIFKDIFNDLFFGFLFSFVSGIMLYISVYELLPKSLDYKNFSLSLSWFMLGIIFFLLVHIFMH